MDSYSSSAAGWSLLDNLAFSAFTARASFAVKVFHKEASPNLNSEAPFKALASVKWGHHGKAVESVLETELVSPMYIMNKRISAWAVMLACVRATTD